MTVDLPSREGQPCRVSLLGKATIKGRLRSGTYVGTGGPDLWFGERLRLALHMRNGLVNGYVNGQRVIGVRHRPGKPVPQSVGKWGFRLTSLQGTVKRIDITD
jgi:hypothetical protein